MVLRNSSGKIITNNLKEAKSLSDQLLGLLNKNNPRFLLFKTRFGIHTFFLKEPIDVLILDNQGRVVQIKTNLKPNRLFFWNPKYSLVLEMPYKTIDKFKIKLKSLLTW